MGILGSKRSILLGDRVKIKGDIFAQEDVIIGKNSVVEGTVKSNERVTIGSNTKILGPIYCSGTVTVGESSSLQRIISNGDVKVGKKSEVEFISSNDSVNLQDGVKASEGVEFFSRIALGENVKIDGEMKRKEEPTEIIELLTTVFADSERKEKDKEGQDDGFPNPEEILALKRPELIELCEEFDLDAEGSTLELQASLIKYIAEQDKEEAPKKKGRKKGKKKSKKEEAEKKKETKTCSTCGQDLIYIKQYDKWYCYKCVKYEEV
jgi:hypothetical protein